MITPKTVEEVKTVEHYRAKSTLRPDEKRLKIARVAGMVTAAGQLPPAKAAGMLMSIWAARQSLDWGCRSTVGQ